MFEYLIKDLIIPTFLGELRSKKIEIINEKEIVYNIKDKIDTFNERFNNTEVDSGGFQKYMEETDVKKKIYDYLFAIESNEGLTEDEFIEIISRDCIDYVNIHNTKIHKGYIKIEKDFIDYFKDLINLLKEYRKEILSQKDKIEIKILSEKIDGFERRNNEYLKSILESYELEKINPATWEEWSKYKENLQYKFEVDENISNQVKMLQDYFKDTNNKVARMIGLSGLGKTRIALEVFRPNENDLESKINSKKVIYVDASYYEKEILHILASMRKRKLTKIFVIDNCKLELHKKIVREVEHQDSKFQVLTIDYNIEKESPSSYPIVELEQVSEEIIKKIINQSYKDIPEDDKNRVVKFAQGFPQMAVLICESLLNNDDTLGRLNDTEMANKLLWGRDEKDDKKLEIIQACSIFENFGYKDDKKVQMDYIWEKICDDRIHYNEFYKGIKYFEDKGIIDKRGRYLAVTPLPLAIRLASQWWRECSPEKGKEIIFSEMPNGMSEFLCNQISKLHFVEEARDLTKDLCSDTGPFGQAEILFTKKGGRIFRSLSQIDPQSTSLAIYNLIKDIPLDKLKDISNERREIVRALENLCFWENSFDNAIITLIKLAIVENEYWSNNSTGIARQLFHIFLSGTQATPKQRLNIIREVLDNDDERYKVMGIKLLGSAIETKGFSRLKGVEYQGSRKSEQEWIPKTWKEVFDYWDESLDILSDIAKNDDELGELARDEVLSSFRGLVQYGRIDGLDKFLNIVPKNLNIYWINIIKIIDKIIKYDGSKIPKEGIEKLNYWKNLYSPVNIPEKLKLIVSLPEYDFIKYEDREYINQSEIKCREFVQECIQHMDEIFSNLNLIYIGEQRQGYTFGEELAKKYKYPKKFIDSSIEFIKDNQTNINLSVLSGFLYGLRQINPTSVKKTLDYIANDNIMKKYLVRLTSGIKPNNDDIDRIIKFIQKEDSNVSDFRLFAYGKCISDLDKKSLKKLIQYLYNMDVEGKLIALQIIHTYEIRNKDINKILNEIILDINVIINLTQFSQMDEYYFTEELEYILKEQDKELFINSLYRTIMNFYLDDNRENFKIEELFQNILKMLLKSNSLQVWNLLVNDIMQADENKLWKIEDLLRGGWLSLEGDYSLIDLIDNEIIIDSLDSNEKLAVIVSRITKKYDSEGEILKFNKIIKYIIENYGIQNVEILQNISSRMGPTSWCGSIIPIYKDKITVLEEYKNHENVNVRKWANDKILSLEKIIKKEELIEKEESKGIY